MTQRAETKQRDNTGWVLVVEDDPADIELLRLAFEQCPDVPTVDVARDGGTALLVLAQHAQEPDWILLDLNLPRLTGKQLLERLRREPRFERVPIVVFSSSDQLQDVTDCYERGANCYVEKPDQFSELVFLLQRLTAFWRNTRASHSPSVPPPSTSAGITRLTSGS